MSLVARAMGISDLAEVLAIEQAVYEFPWPRQAFEQCVRLGYHCVLACVEGDDDDQVCGYAIMDLGARDAHICNVSVAEARQGQGVGRFLMDALLAFARMRGASRVYLEVRPSNQVAQAFYRRLGFSHAGLRRDYYRARVGVEDAHILRLEL